MIFNLTELIQVTEKVLEKIKSLQNNQTATIVVFSGDLGAGKTTLIKEIGKHLGVLHDMQSPTFSIYKKYPTNGIVWNYLIHGDMYRLDSGDDMKKLGWDELVSDPGNIICIEWPEKISEIIPEHAIFIDLKHISEKERSIDFL